MPEVLETRALTDGHAHEITGFSSDEDDEDDLPADIRREEWAMVLPPDNEAFLVHVKNCKTHHGRVPRKAEDTAPKNMPVREEPAKPAQLRQDTAQQHENSAISAVSIVSPPSRPTKDVLQESGLRYNTAAFSPAFMAKENLSEPDVEQEQPVNHDDTMHSLDLDKEEFEESYGYDDDRYAPSPSPSYHSEPTEPSPPIPARGYAEIHRKQPAAAPVLSPVHDQRSDPEFEQRRAPPSTIRTEARPPREPKHPSQVPKFVVAEGLMDFCPFCGVRFIEDALFCGRCGAERMAYEP
ncbi:hypothetical protein J8273_3288 [Carpediemonas membranifera]|uniref:Zinc-ribbon domain-containing protein n=1 Tax=Carpediemonas membranifera TaxID=201153 RepID=A0A8J6DZ52_9EUKA|nr:hypothetical protein J8273_3288 [Carpediemonas membranifera]|eukprot:KAG9393159.1 hypothetical protein J8273_3288 [Carpediemonas membranifera]